MTIGPAPMIRMEWMSVRLGIPFSLHVQVVTAIGAQERPAQHFVAPAGVNSRCQWHCSAPSGSRTGSQISRSRRQVGDGRRRSSYSRSHRARPASGSRSNAGFERSAR